MWRPSDERAPGRGCIAALVIAFACGAGPTPAQQAGRIEPYRGTSGPAGILWLPAEAVAVRPVPAVVIAQDGLGYDTRSRRYAFQLVAAGLAVLELDLGTSTEDAASVAGAAAELAQDPRIERERIGVLGFGTGAQAAALTAQPEGGGPDPFAARAMLYPGCSALLDTLSVTSPGAPAMRSPVLLLHGDADPTNPSAACAALATALMETAPVRRVEYAGAGYAWDRPAFAVEGPTLVPRPDRKGRIRAAPWPALADLSAAQVAQFFAHALH